MTVDRVGEAAASGRALTEDDRCCGEIQRQHNDSPFPLTRGQTCSRHHMKWRGGTGAAEQVGAELFFSPPIREPSEAGRAALARLFEVQLHRIVLKNGNEKKKIKPTAEHQRFSVSTERNMIELDLQVIIAKW